MPDELQEWKQEMFNRGYLGLASQGFKRSVYGASCMYNGPNGMHCIFGWCVPAEKRCFLSEMGTVDVQHTEVLQSVGVGTSYEKLDFLRYMQRVHDSSTNDSLRAELHAFAERQGLTIPEDTTT